MRSGQKVHAVDAQREILVQRIALGQEICLDMKLVGTLARWDVEGTDLLCNESTHTMGN